MRWIRRAVFGWAASWAWRNRERIKRNVSDLIDGSPQTRPQPAGSRS